MMKIKPFMVIISPDDYVTQQIASFKKECADRIGAFKGSGSKAHISIGTIREPMNHPGSNVSIVERYFQIVERDFTAINAVDLKITGFNYFVHGAGSRTIYAAIELSESTMDLFYKIRQILKWDKPIVPHITIAKAISTDNFNILWPHFEHRSFKHTFTAAQLTVLSKEDVASTQRFEFNRYLVLGERFEEKVEESILTI